MFTYPYLFVYELVVSRMIQFVLILNEWTMIYMSHNHNRYPTCICGHHKLSCPSPHERTCNACPLLLNNNYFKLNNKLLLLPCLNQNKEIENSVLDTFPNVAFNSHK